MFYWILILDSGPSCQLLLSHKYKTYGRELTNEFAENGQKYDLCCRPNLDWYSRKIAELNITDIQFIRRFNCECVSEFIKCLKDNDPLRNDQYPLRNDQYDQIYSIFTK